MSDWEDNDPFFPEKKNNKDKSPWGDDFFNDETDPFSLDDREKLLESFLDDLSEQEPAGSAIEQYDKPMGILDMSPADFPEIEITEDTAQKITYLQQVVTSLEVQNKDVVFDPNSVKTGFKIDYRKSLNPQQLAAVATTEGPLLVIAGAGSGKTRVIVHRVSYLIENNIDPQQILLLTFTRKAAREMISRVEQLLKDNAVKKVTGGTFHSFAVYALRKYANLLQLPTNFTIIDTGDSEDVIDLIRSQLKYNQTDKQFPKKARIYNIISTSRNKNQTIQQVIEMEYTGLEEYINDIELIAKGYAQYKKMSRIFDFDDLLEKLRDGLRDNSIFRSRLQNDYRYIMVDEYQDTNVVQKEIIDHIAQKHKNVMVVGDDAQSIYAFRGANYENILRFPETYPQCRVIKIEQNYRSNQTLLNFTNELIHHAKIGYKKQLFSQNNNVFLPIIHKLYDQEEEAIFIVDRISELIEKDIPLSEIAVLNRADWHNRYIQIELTKRGIPYVVVGGFRFNERMHVKDIIAYLRVVFNPMDAVAWHRILKIVPGIGKITATNLVNHIRKESDKFNFIAFSKKNFYDELHKLASMLQDATNPKRRLAEKLEIIKDYYVPLLKNRIDDDFEARMLDIDVLIEIGSKTENIDRFLSDFALDPPSRMTSGKSTPLVDEAEEDGKITISTVHSAKGLEWYVVFIPHALDGLFPSNRALNIEDMEEERRLFYVACSRAKEQLYITFPAYIASYNSHFHYPSRFLVEMGHEKFRLLENI